MKKLDPKKINISVSEGVVKMDTATQNQYYDSYAKVQVLTTSHRCKVRRPFHSGPLRPRDPKITSILDLQSFHQFRDWNVGAHNGAQLEAVNEFQLGTLPLKISSIEFNISEYLPKNDCFCCFYVSGASIQIFLAENWSLCISKFNLNKSTRSHFCQFLILC